MFNFLYEISIKKLKNVNLLSSADNIGKYTDFAVGQDFLKKMHNHNIN